MIGLCFFIRNEDQRPRFLAVADLPHIFVYAPVGGGQAAALHDGMMLTQCRVGAIQMAGRIMTIAVNEKLKPFSTVKNDKVPLHAGFKGFYVEIVEIIPRGEPASPCAIIFFRKLGVHDLGHGGDLSFILGDGRVVQRGLAGVNAIRKFFRQLPRLLLGYGGGILEAY